MRLSAPGAMAIGLTAMLSACVHPVDPEGRRPSKCAAVGAVLGTMTGIALGATFAIGSTIGVPSSAARPAARSAPRSAQ